MLDLSDGEDKPEEPKTKHYLSELLLRPLLETKVKKESKTPGIEKQKLEIKEQVEQFSGIVQKYKLSKAKEDALSNLNDYNLLVFGTNKTRE